METYGNILELEGGKQRKAFGCSSKRKTVIYREDFNLD
jgi:hypothetical protein